MDRVLTAFWRSIVSQLHPKMLALLILPFVLSIVGWIIVATLIWTPLTDWLGTLIFGGTGWLGSLYSWAQGHGMAGIREWVPALIALLLVVPLGWGTAVVLVAVFAMPVVIRFLGARRYADVARFGSLSPLPGIWNALVAIVVFVIGYLVTLPLWLIPPLALIVPWLWWSWLTARVLRLDSLAEHADASERRALIARYRRDYLLLALIVTALNYIPPLFLITPVLSALAFAHYSLALLQTQRGREAAIALPVREPGPPHN